MATKGGNGYVPAMPDKFVIVFARPPKRTKRRKKAQPLTVKPPAVVRAPRPKRKYGFTIKWPAENPETDEER